MYVMHLNSTCNQVKSIFVEQREDKEVPTKSYGRGNGIFPPPPKLFSEQPSVQTCPKQGKQKCKYLFFLVMLCFVYFYSFSLPVLS